MRRKTDQQALIRRRTLLQGLGVGGLAATVGVLSPASSFGGPGSVADIDSPLLFHSPKLTPFVDQLPRLPILTGTDITLTANSTTHSFHRDLPPSKALAYSGADYLGPTIEARSGIETTFALTNEMGAHPLGKDMDMTLHGMQEDYRRHPPTVMHLHGGVTPADSDGHPEQMISPGQTVTHRFPQRQEAAHMWYHDHAMGFTRLNVYAGLAGMYFLRDEFDTGRIDNPLGLPAGNFELPLVLQEKIFESTGQQSVRSTAIVPEGSWEGGAVGDVGVVNGKIWPQMSVSRGLYRFRVINAGSYSVWNLHFSNGMQFFVIGNDGGLLDAPVAATHIRLAPAERYDILVDFATLAEGESVELRNDEAPPFQAAVIGAVTMPLFCRFVADGSTPSGARVPRTLRGPAGPLPLPPIATPTVFRDVTVSQPYILRNPPSIMTLNNLKFSSDDIEKPRQGTVEQWNIINITPDPHPIHIHLVHFRILGRQALRTVDYQLAPPQPPVGTRWTPSAEGFVTGPLVPPEPWESGWKDTVRIDGGTVTRIVVRFPTAEELGFDPDEPFSAMAHITGDARTGQPGAAAHGGGAGHGGEAGAHAHKDLQGYVWHCHLLDHEDHDMMLKYRVVQ